MDVNLGYAAWLMQIDNENSTLKLTFNDDSSVLFCLAAHTTQIDADAQAVIQASDVD